MEATDNQFQQYLPVVILGVFALGFVIVSSIASALLGNLVNRNRLTPNRMKDTAYECGMLPQGSGTPRLSVKFHLVAMLFILFDIEVVFLYPWAVVYKEQLAHNAAVILASMASFLGILFFGYIYALKKRAFEWRRQ
jgi:NADH-quinone oxidoreductase subunit A